MVHLLSTKRGIAVGCAILLQTTGSPASAQVSPPAAYLNVSYDIIAGSGYPRIANPVLEGNGSTTLSLLSSPVPMVGIPYARSYASTQSVPTISATAAVSAGYRVTAAASMQYYVMVNGPNAGVSVPIDYLAFLEAEVTGDAHNVIGTSSTQLQLGGHNSGQLAYWSVGACEAQCAGGVIDANSLSVQSTVAVLSGDYFSVFMSANAYGYGGGTGYAYVDPFFYIDPTFLAAHPGYSLTFSPFVSNDPPAVATVPEPVTWAMMIAGFGIVGVAMRRRKAVARVLYAA